MSDYFFTFRSVTAAMKGSRALERAGIKSALSRTPKSLQQQGCGYSLRVRAEALRQAQEILIKEEARFHKIYRKDAKEQWLEVTG